MSELTPQHVLADLFGSGDFPPEILLAPAHTADVVINQLLDADFAPWASEISQLHQPRPGRMDLPNGLSDPSGASAWIMW